MLPKDKRKLALLIGAGILLVAFCTAIVMIIDARLDVDFGTDDGPGELCAFIVACIFLPRALRGYRAGRRQTPKIVWYRRLDLILCLTGLIMGVDFVLSVVRNWLMFISMNNINAFQYMSDVWDQEIEAFDIARVAVGVIEIIFVVVLVYQAIKRRSMMSEPGNGGVG